LSFGIGWNPSFLLDNKLPITRRRTKAHYLPTRLLALALFGRRPPQRVVRSTSPAAENLSRSGHKQRYSITSFARAPLTVREPGSSRRITRRLLRGYEA
jgi:hypothetical protein